MRPEAARTAVDEWRSYLIERWTPEGPGDLPPPPPSNDPRLWEVFWAAAEGRIIL